MLKHLVKFFESFQKLLNMQSPEYVHEEFSPEFSVPLNMKTEEMKMDKTSTVSFLCKNIQLSTHHC